MQVCAWNVVASARGSGAHVAPQGQTSTSFFVTQGQHIPENLELPIHGGCFQHHSEIHFGSLSEILYQLTLGPGPVVEKKLSARVARAVFLVFI